MLNHKTLFSFVKNCQAVFQKTAVPFPFPPTRNESSFHFASLLALGIVNFFNFSHSNG